jgi:hypothetical protein
MSISVLPSFREKLLDTSENAFGGLRSSEDVRQDACELRQRFEMDGYLYVPGLLDRNQVLQARLALLQRLDGMAYLDSDYLLTDGIVKIGAVSSSLREFAADDGAVAEVLYHDPMIDFFELFLGGPVRHFGYVWQRAIPPGSTSAIPPHCDLAFKGIDSVYTSWTPLGDIPLIMGGIMILENSHQLDAIKSTYGQYDGDNCVTGDHETNDRGAEVRHWQTGVGCVAYSDDAVSTRAELGGHWLTSDFSIGDVLIFGMYTIHAGLDNHTNRLSLSSDTRYQLVAGPVDEHSSKENPVGQGPTDKIDKVC